MGFQSYTNYNLLGICCLFPFLSYCFLPTHAGECSLKNAFLSNMGIKVWWGGQDTPRGMLSIRISGVTPVFSCAAGQMGPGKSSLRHKVKPTELIFSPKNNVTFWLAECVFFFKASPQDACFLWKLTINTKVNCVPRGCPPPSHLLNVGTLHKRHTLFREIYQNLLLIILTSENQFESAKGRLKPVGNSYYNEWKLETAYLNSITN